MTYELYVTREFHWPPDREHWSQNTDTAIAFEQWTRLVEDDPELAIDYADRLSMDDIARIVADNAEFAGCTTAYAFSFSKEQIQRLKEIARELKKGDAPNIEELGYDTAQWNGHPKGEKRCFWFAYGTISTKNPDIATIDKMMQLSTKLDACVRGDDGEIYRRIDRGIDCFTPAQGWLPFEKFHSGRRGWAPAIIREILDRPS